MTKSNKYSKGSSFDEYVFSLSDDDFFSLCESVNKRKNKQKYGASNFEELALKYGKTPICPNCKSTDLINHSHTESKAVRYSCKVCGSRFTLLHDSIFHSTKKNLDTWINYLVLMTFNVPLELTEEVCQISHATAMLWRKKVFSTINDCQNNVKLRGTIWIDEAYIFDSRVLRDESYKSKRGLSKNQICIIVAIDCFENIYAAVCGNGKPSSARVYNALKDHIEKESLIIHDGEKAHNLLIDKLGCRSKVYKADIKSKEYLENMALINNMCSWLKRYIFRYVGMRKENLQSYLNWFVYIFRVKKSDENWPKISRILRHLVLYEGQYKR